MNEFLKNLGIILIVIAAIGMMVAYTTGGSDYNWVMGLLMLVMCGGLVAHIILNKKIQD
jgi:hypothetical protein BACCOPRO_03484